MVDYLGEHNIAEGSFKLNVISRQEIKVTNLDCTDSTEFIDRYHPYKYGVIFKERLFVNNPEVFATFRLNMFKIEGDKVVEESKGGAPANPKDKKPAAGKGAVSAATALLPPTVDYDHAKELDTPRMIYLELFEEDDLKQSVSGLNETALPSIVLSGEKQGNRNYYLQARFELRDFPEAASANEQTHGIFWCLSVSGTDVCCLYSDHRGGQRHSKRRKREGSHRILGSA